MRRKITFARDKFYHIFTRGIDGREIFTDESYYSYFLSLLEHCLNYGYPYSTLKNRLKKAQSPHERQEIFAQLETKRIAPPVEVISFCLMPTHPHLTLKQLEDSGITVFLHRLFTAYSHYFNIRYQRSGPLFESTFKAALVDSDEQLIHLSRYQHINPRALGLNTVEELANYPWSSLAFYLGERDLSFVNADAVLSLFPSSEEYSAFVSAEIDEYEPMRLEGVAIDDDFGWFARFRQLEASRKEELRRNLETLF